MSAALLCLMLLGAEPDAPVDVAALQQDLQATQARVDALESRADWLSKLASRFSGYADVGFFWVQGNGSGVRKDFGHKQTAFGGPLLGSWTLVGDPLSTAINTRGEPADIGDARAIRFDAIHAGGHPSFIVNAVNLQLFSEIIEGLTVTASLDFLPRDRDLSTVEALGNFFDLKLAFLRYELELGKVWLAFYAGKFDSVLGVEYRDVDSTSRTGVTPSLLCRYTCGHPVGAKVKAGFFERSLEVWLAVTNGSHQSDLFPFSNETDFNSGKTVAGRVQYSFGFGLGGLELSASGAIGTQDRQTDDSILQWHYGFAALATIGDFTASAEFITGRAQGKSDVSSPAQTVRCGVAACLFYRGAYGQVAWRATRLFTPYLRVDWRSAIHQRGIDYAYVSEAARGTLGLRVDINRYLIVKAEYVLNRELNADEFPDDVFTTSVVVTY
jgi:hypothetical protein